MENRSININITPGSVITTILLLLGVFLIFVLKDLVLVVLTAVVIASAVEPGVLWFMRYGIPRVFSVFLVYTLAVGVLVGSLYFFLPPLLNEASTVFAEAPEYMKTFELPEALKTGASFFSASSLATSTVGTSDSKGFFEFVQEVEQAFANSSEGVIRTVSTVFGGLFSFVLIVVLSFYFAVQETGVDDFLRVITPVRYQQYVLDLWRRSHMKIGLWMQGQILLSVLIAVLVYLGLTILGVPYALLLALLAGVFELVPVFGSILASLPGIAIAFADGGTTLALVVIGFYLIINQFQSNLIYPLVVKKIVGVPPLLVILALIAGAQLAGFLGIIIAVPLAAALQEFVNDIQRKKQRELERIASGA